MEKFERSLERFRKSFEKFKEVVSNPALDSLFKDEFLVEITTKRFEYTFESMWKTTKEFLKSQGIECNSPKSCFRELIKEGVVDEDLEEILAKLIILRNELVHVYDEEMANRIYEEIKKDKVLGAIKKVLDGLSGEVV